jgi:GNAT superfamily N-acetyltransferase
VAFAEGRMIGYIAGHLTERHGCAGEVQYLFVAPAWRKQGTASTLLRLMAKWFQDNAAAKVCVCVDAGSPAAMPFYRSRGARPLAPIPGTGRCGKTSASSSGLTIRPTARPNL